MERRGFFLIADITGYTAYLGASELEHARQTLTELLELVVDQTRSPWIVAQLEGDAVLSYALADGFVTAQTFLESVEATYVEFRRAIDLMVLNTTCACNACANIATLDLKFFVHHGSFALQRVGEITQLVGTDVNLVHRLLKNSVTADTGVRAYLLITEAAVEALGIDTQEEGSIVHRETVPDFGEVTMAIEDLQPSYEAAKRLGRDFYRPQDVLMSLTTEISLPVEDVWNYVNHSEFRNLIIGSDSYVIADRNNGRVAAGSTYQCYHGTMTVSQLVLEWQPFERVVFQQLVPLPGRRPTHAIFDLRFVRAEGGTQLHQTATKPAGPWPQRSVARMMMRAQRGRLHARVEEFRARIIEDHAGNREADGARLQPTSTLIEAAVSESLRESQVDSDG